MLKFFFASFTCLFLCFVLCTKSSNLEAVNESNTGMALFKVEILVANDTIFQKIAKKMTITISAPDMNTIYKNIPINSNLITSTIYNIPAGKHRLFYTAVYDSLNILRYMDSVYSDVIPYSTISIPIKITRVMGNVTLNISVSETTTVSTTFVIGQNYGGGIIFYLDKTGQHGLIAPPVDQSTGMPFNGVRWGCTGNFLNITDTSLGSGKSNTDLMLSKCSDSPTAASLCDTCQYGGFSDWYLPSKQELDILDSRASIVGGGLDVNAHWSSSEYDSANAWYGQGHTGKDYTACVRAIRSF